MGKFYYSLQLEQLSYEDFQLRVLLVKSKSSQNAGIFYPAKDGPLCFSFSSSISYLRCQTFPQSD